MEFTNLDVWTESRKLSNLIYDSTKNYPKEEVLILCKKLLNGFINYYRKK